MKAIAIIGRVLYALPLVVFGLMHLTMANNMVSIVPPCVAGGVFWVYFTGVCLIAAAASIISGKYTKVACLCLALLLVIFVITIHLPNVLSGDQMRMQMGMPGLLKDTAMAGAALVLAGIYWNEDKQ